MKIAVFVNQYPCPSETFVSNQVTGLLKRGHVVHVYARNRDKGYKFGADSEFRGNGERIVYLNDSPLGTQENKLTKTIKLLSILAKSPRKEVQQLLGCFNVRKFGRRALALNGTLLNMGARLLSNGPYHVVHCHFGNNGVDCATLKHAGVLNAKVVTTFHGYDLSSYLTASGAQVYHGLFDWGDLFMPVSTCWKELLIKLGCDPKKIVVHRMGVDPQLFNFRARMHEDGTTVRVLSVGRLVEKKGFTHGIQAFAKVVRKFPALEYKIVGDGVLREELSRLIKRLNLDCKVHLLGWRGPKEVADLLDEADFFLAPSVTASNGDQEGIPVSIMEAMARGLPIISTNHSGIPELVQDGVSGFLVREKDDESLAKSMEYLISHREIWARMGESGRAWVVRHFNVEKLNDALVNRFEQLLEGNQPDSRMVSEVRGF